MLHIETEKLSKICKICGASANFTNFGVVSCSSCKMFFKRNAESSKPLICDFTSSCEVNIYNRHICAACRLAKCFAVGMQTTLIRGSRLRKNKKRQKNLRTPNEPNNRSTQLTTLNLLQSDQSNLNSEQWNLLSNLIHCFDEHSGLKNAYRFLSDQLAIQPKARFKSDVLRKYAVTNMRQVQTIYERNGDYLSLNIEDRTTLLRRTLEQTSAFGSTFISSHSGLLDDVGFYQSSTAVFGEQVMTKIINVRKQFDQDVIFLKLILSILTFSTNIFDIDSDWSKFEIIDRKKIFQIQNTYIELAWNYMVYKYTHQQAVLRFCSLLRCLFNLSRAISHARPVKSYNDTLERVIIETEHVLNLN